MPGKCLENTKERTEPGDEECMLRQADHRVQTVDSLELLCRCVLFFRREESTERWGADEKHEMTGVNG